MNDMVRQNQASESCCCMVRTQHTHLSWLKTLAGENFAR